MLVFESVPKWHWDNRPTLILKFTLEIFILKNGRKNYSILHTNVTLAPLHCIHLPSPHKMGLDTPLDYNKQ